MLAPGLPTTAWSAPPHHQEEGGDRLLPRLEGFRQSGKRPSNLIVNWKPTDTLLYKKEIFKNHDIRNSI